MIEALPQIILSLILGGAIGCISGMLGIGGGLVAVPCLVLLYGMPQPVAQGTALLMMVFNMTIGFWQYRKRNVIPFRQAVLLCVGGIIASYLAARLATQFDTNLLQKLVGIYVIALSIHMFWKSTKKPNAALVENKKAVPNWLLPFVGGAGGACMGFFGIGGGVMVTPILCSFFLMSQTAAQGLTLAMVAPGAMVAFGTYAFIGMVNWSVAIPMCVGSIGMVSYGVRFAHKLPERKLRAVFSIVLFISGLLMLNG